MHISKRFDLSSSRVDALDGLRGLAVLAVFVFHLPSRVLQGGWLSVDLFFVLSGYLITGLLRRELENTGRIDLQRFIARRCLRLFPAFFAMLFGVALHAWLTLPWAGGVWRQVLVAGSFAANWWRAFSPSLEGAVAHTWSLAAEQQFYLIWPLVLPLLWRGRRRGWLLALIALTVCWRAALLWTGADFERTYNGFDARADGLLVGCALALFPLSARLRLAARAWVAIPLAGLSAAFLWMGYQSVAAQALGLFPCVLLFAWVVLAATERGWLAEALSVRPLATLGRISYGFYLWHVPILAWGSALVPRGWGGAAILLAATLVAASASYWLLERPFITIQPAAIGRAWALGWRALAHPPRFRAG